MVRSTAYVIACTARNKLVRRLRRLRERRYLVGALVGVLYVTLTLIMRERAYETPAGANGGSSGAAPSELEAFGTALGAALLAGAAAAAWLLPFKSGLLEFSRAETAFLFPAPVTRQQLVIYRVMRSQVAVLAGALIVALAYPTGSIVARLGGLVSVWVILMTSHVFFTVVTIGRGPVLRGQRAAFAWLAGLVSAGGAAAVGFGLFRSLRDASVTTVEDLAGVVTDAVQPWPTSVLLTPFVWLVRPLFANGAWDFFERLFPAVFVYVATVAWLLWADLTSPDTADAGAERVGTKDAGDRSPAYSARPAAWQLGPAGRVEWVFAWKGALQTFRSIDARALARSLIVLGVLLALTLLVTRERGIVLLVGVFSAWAAIFSILLVPQIVRMDLREDLAYLGLLKTWPIRGRAVLRGEIVWPSIVVTVMAWAFGLVAMATSLASRSGAPFGSRGSFWLALLLATPGMVLAQYTMHNGMAVLFPGWVPLGAARTRGVDAIGQRLIMLAATWIGLLVALLPGGVVIALLFTAFGRPALDWILPAGAFAMTVGVAFEMLLVTQVLGPVFERLDVTSVEPPE